MTVNSSSHEPGILKRYYIYFMLIPPHLLPLPKGTNKNSRSVTTLINNHLLKGTEK